MIVWVQLLVLLLGAICTIQAQKIPDTRFNLGPLAYPTSLQSVPNVDSCLSLSGQRSCKPAVECASFFVEIAVKPVLCKTKHNTYGTCCKEELGIFRLGVSRFPQVSKSVALPASIPPLELQKIAQRGIQIIESLVKREATGYFPSRGAHSGQMSTTYAHSVNLKPKEESVNLGYKAIKLAEVTRAVADRLYLPAHLAGMATQQIDVSNTQLAESCDLRPVQCIDYSFPYRSYDGSCNNKEYPKWGKALTPLERLLPPDYYDGIWSPRYRPGMPSPRKLSETLFTDIDVPNKHISMLTMHWGQFVSHDISHVPMFKTSSFQNIECCNDGKHMPNGVKHPLCYPLSVEEDETFYKRMGVECLNMVRSIIAPRDGCTLGYTDQLNQMTHYIDGSTVYGSSYEENEELREHEGGRLKFTLVGGKEFPPVMKKEDGCRGVPEEGCFITDGSTVYGSSYEENEELREHEGGRLKFTLVGGKEFPPVMKKEDGCQGVPKKGCFITDGSTVYGSSYEENEELREHEGGRLKFTLVGGIKFPPVMKKEDGCQGVPKKGCFITDGSTVYGSSYEENEELREHEGGRLKFTLVGGIKFPPVIKKEDGCQGVPKKGCFITGDSRGNQYVGLTVIHTLLLRTHNRIARILERLNTHWDDERIFQETRKIVGAIIQHITYNEYLPTVLGTPLPQEYGLLPLAEGYSNTYDEYVKTAVTNEFTTSAYRFGHSLISNNIELWMDDFHTIFGGILPMKKTFHKPGILLLPGAFDVILRGMMKMPAQNMDSHFASTVTRFLFQEEGKDYGLDLASINIHRGRDHGLPGYNYFRSLCGLRKADTFMDLADTIEIQNVLKLQRLYNDVDDIDLYVGGVLEKPIKEAILGPVFSCIVADQFARLKDGDRFYYEHGGLPNSFNLAQLQAIRKVSIATLICENSDEMDFVLPFATWTVARINPWLPCSEIESLDLLAWFEPATLNLNSPLTDAEEKQKIDEIKSSLQAVKTSMEKVPGPPIPNQAKTAGMKSLKAAVKKAAILEKLAKVLTDGATDHIPAQMDQNIAYLPVNYDNSVQYLPQPNLGGLFGTHGFSQFLPGVSSISQNNVDFEGMSHINLDDLNNVNALNGLSRNNFFGLTDSDNRVNVLEGLNFFSGNTLVEIPTTSSGHSPNFNFLGYNNAVPTLNGLEHYPHSIFEDTSGFLQPILNKRKRQSKYYTENYFKAKANSFEKETMNTSSQTEKENWNYFPRTLNPMHSMNLIDEMSQSLRQNRRSTLRQGLSMLPEPVQGLDNVHTFPMTYVKTDFSKVNLNQKKYPAVAQKNHFVSPEFNRNFGLPSTVQPMVSSHSPLFGLIDNAHPRKDAYLFRSTIDSDRNISSIYRSSHSPLKSLGKKTGKEYTLKHSQGPDIIPKFKGNIVP